MAKLSKSILAGIVAEVSRKAHNSEGQVQDINLNELASTLGVELVLPKTNEGQLLGTIDELLANSETSEKDKELAELLKQEVKSLTSILSSINKKVRKLPSLARDVDGKVKFPRYYTKIILEV